MNDLRSVDLNLLVVLDALLEEAHVSRAAVRLHLSQPATSSALERLRHLFGDRLLERGRGGMRLTPAAEALRVPLRDALVSIATLVRRGGTDLATVRQTVGMVIAAPLAVTLLPALHARLVRTAPGVTLTWPGTRTVTGTWLCGTLPMRCAPCWLSDRDVVQAGRLTL